MINFSNSFNTSDVDPRNLLCPATAMFVYTCAGEALGAFKRQLPSDVLEDIPSDIYSKMLVSESRFDENKGTSFKTLIQAAARRRAIDILRHAKIDRHVICDSERSDEESSESLSKADVRKLTEFSNPELVCISNEEKEHLEQFIGQLNEREQTIVCSKFNGDCSAEIAQRLDMSAVSVDTAFSRAIAKLKAHRKDFEYKS